MAHELQSELLPDPNGANFDAKWTGRPNAVGLERSSKWSIYSNGAAVPAGTVINISPNEDGTGFVASGIVTTANVTHVDNPPACKSVQLVGIAAANPAPARFICRHGWT